MIELLSARADVPYSGVLLRPCRLRTLQEGCVVEFAGYTYF